MIVTATHIIVGNAGDARCVVSEGGQAIDLSTDHKPDLPSERLRVYQAGHIVEEGRVDGIIAISRAIGDWEYKTKQLDPQKMAVSGYPDVKSHPITSKTEFFICACDGIWDCMTSQEAVDYVKKAKQKLGSYTPSKTAGKKTSKSSPPPRKSSKGKADAKMEMTIDQSQFSGLATVVEMMMEQNCPNDLATSEGLGADNMTCIVVEFGK